MSEASPQNVAVSTPNVKNPAPPKPVPDIDITGQRFGSLVAIEFVRTKDWNTGWRCRCDCGNERVVNGYFLRTGQCVSCGCLRSGTPVVSRELSGTIQSVWQGMMTRCYNPNSASRKRYYDRGIKVCERWHSVDVFATDMPPRPSALYSIDRIDGNGHYSCGKCDECLRNGWPMNAQWATDTQQARNRSSNRMVTYRGETLCMMDMAAKYNVSYFTLRNRISRGWSAEDAIESPIEEDVPIIYKGQSFTLMGLARHTGVNSSTIRGRLRNGWSIEAAIETPMMHPNYRTQTKSG